MKLTAGTKLGPYEIVAPLGSGGMGEVFQARDPRLNRFIAIKVLPAGAAEDPDRRARLESEARAVAALNHPNIVTIHSVDEADGQIFLTMELVEGRTLDAAIPKGGFAMDRLLAIAIPIADAVAAAHQSGITHRDLKPGNIMVGEGDQRDRVKVLDFGLAKLTQAAATPVGISQLLTAAGTSEGPILGTVSYMSPEQAEGKSVDGRSDLFSLGVVLYEMATGRRPFTGETSVSILSSIIKDTPVAVTQLNPTLPRELGRIVRRALKKDPERRYQSAKDLRNDLEELKASLDSGELAASTHSSQPRPVTPSESADARVPIPLLRQHPRAALTVAVGAILIAAVVLTLVARRAAPPTATAPAALADLQVTQLTTSGNAERPAISPDGKYLAYVQHDGNSYSLWIRQTTTASNVRIVAPESGVTILGVTFTPDGSFVDFVRQTGNPQWDVWRVPFLGGTPKLLIRRVLSPIGWSADGQHIAYLRGSDQAGTTAIAVADPDGSQERDLATWRPPIVLLTFNAPWLPSIAPAWSADGHTIAIGVVDRSGGSFKTAVNFVDAATGSIRTAPSPGAITYGVAWLDSESLVLDYATDGPTQLWRFAARTGALSRITNDPNNYLGVNFTADRNGLVTARQEQYADIWTGDAVASNGSAVAERVASDNVSNLAWMGDRLLFSAFVGGHAAVVGLIPDHGMPEEIAAGAFSNAATPDGSTLLLTLRDVSDNTIALWSADPSGRRRTRLATGLTSMQPVVTPDGHSVIFESFAGGRQSMWIASIAGGETRTLVDEPATSADVSPDGKSLVFFQRGPQGSATVLCDLPACTSRRNLAYFESDAPRRWTPDGRAIAYTIRGNLWIQPIDGAPVRQLSHFTDVRPISSFVWSTGGKRLAIARLTVTNDIVLFKGLKQ